MNPRPPALRSRFYMLSSVYYFKSSQPNGQDETTDPLDLTASLAARLTAVLCAFASAGPVDHRQTTGAAGQPLGCQSVSFVVCDYVLRKVFTRGHALSACDDEFHHQRRSQNIPDSGNLLHVAKSLNGDFNNHFKPRTDFFKKIIRSRLS